MTNSKKEGEQGIMTGEELINALEERNWHETDVGGDVVHSLGPTTISCDEKYIAYLDRRCDGETTHSVKTTLKDCILKGNYLYFSIGNDVVISRFLQKR